MNSPSEKDLAGKKQPSGEAEPELTDEQLRELMAQAEAPSLTPDRRKAAVARLQNAIKKRVELEGPTR